jgi:hypothetical protein
MNPDILRQDAVEMIRILSTARCATRHSIISPDRLSEILTAIVTAGELVGGNSKGYDVISPEFGRVEVKARILGTDGPFPRVSLKASNITKAGFFMAVRWTNSMQLHDAVALPQADAAALYSAKRQGSGLAHIAWRDWVAAPAARRFRDEMRLVLGQADSCS